MRITSPQYLILWSPEAKSQLIGKDPELEKIEAGGVGSDRG